MIRESYTARIRKNTRRNKGFTHCLPEYRPAADSEPGVGIGSKRRVADDRVAATAGQVAQNADSFKGV